MKVFRMKCKNRRAEKIVESCNGKKVKGDIFKRHTSF